MGKIQICHRDLMGTIAASLYGPLRDDDVFLDCVSLTVSACDGTTSRGVVHINVARFDGAVWR